ncbi:MAG TPA: helix-turn-helix domain-containing protein, partial [Hyphomicrobiaceae bacterium]|nr:helix-turn-helix domain-containing protein [Hyphomicrobiaceae bacterium]
DIIGIAKAASILGVSERTLERRLADRHSVVPRPFSYGAGKKRLFRRIDVEEFVKARALLGQHVKR